MERFAEFVATRSDTIDLADPHALAEAWRAWATLFDPAAVEPTREAFEHLAATFAPVPRIERPTPLASWRFTGTLRRYQADVLERVPVVAGEPLHIVAPPGSGKTLLGLLLARERGGRVLALAPTTTIRAQWARAAEEHLDGAVGAVSQDPLRLADLTALTYQALSVLEQARPLEDLAVAEWTAELVAAGRVDTDATAWIERVRRDNESAYRSGVARRSRNLRRRLAREDPAFLEQALHPNARQLVDRLIEHGVETIVLDECHHLLDHWALVVAYLVGRIRAAGGVPLLIGLTATLPSREDEDAFDIYTSLLGDVDYEVPTPAVVKEGNLAPYRDFVHFTEPTDDELDFLRRHEQELAALVRDLLAAPEGVAFLERALQPRPEVPALAPEPPAPPGPSAELLAAAFADDFGFSESAARMLLHVAPEHPLVALLPVEASTAPDTDASIRVLARFALDRVLPDATRAAEWTRITRLVRDFGYTLTDRGIRRGRDPIDTVLASSASKDHAAAEILRLELLRADGYPVKAVVVTDFTVHGNQRGSRARRAGALRCFDVLAADPVLAALRPVLVTAEHLRVATRDAPVLLPALAARLGVAALTADPVRGSAGVSEVDVGGAGSAAVVAAVSDLVTDGTVGVIVGTRALLGEGWDCPAINTLVDLTSVATSSATQQLRGRTLRLDPAWPRKVAHNWTVTTLIPPQVAIADQPDADRMRRKHGRVWGLLREDSTQIVRGVGIALSTEQQALLSRITGKQRPASTADLNADVLANLPSREQSHRDWRIGEPYVDRERVSAIVPSGARAFRTGPAMEFVLALLLGSLAAIAYPLLRAIAPLVLVSPVLGVVVLLGLLAGFVLLTLPLFRMLGQAIRQNLGPADTYRGIVLALASTFQGMGRMRPYGRGDVAAVVHRQAGHATEIEVGLAAGPYAEQRLITDSLEELLGPVRVPRFLLQVNRGAPPPGSNPAVRVAMWLIAVLSRRERYLPVPAAIGRRRRDAEAFAAAWRREVGPCTLHELRTPEQLALLVRARRDAAGARGAFARDAWS